MPDGFYPPDAVSFPKTGFHVWRSEIANRANGHLWHPRLFFATTETKKKNKKKGWRCKVIKEVGSAESRPPDCKREITAQRRLAPDCLCVRTSSRVCAFAGSH